MAGDGQGEEDYDVMITNVPPNSEQQKQLLLSGVVILRVSLDGHREWD